MTGAHMNDFIGQIAEAYRALQAEPDYRDCINGLEIENNGLRDTIQRLELVALDRKAEIDGLHSRIRSLEVERDDHSFRHLEAQDAANVLANVLRTVQATVGEALAAAQPDLTAQIKADAVQPGVDYFTPGSAEVVMTGTANVDSQSTLGETTAAPSSAYADDGCISPEPPQPTEVNVPELEGESATLPTGADVTLTVDGLSTDATPPTVSVSSAAAMEAEAKPPFASSASIEPPNASLPTAPQDASPSSGAQPAEAEGPYKGKLYANVPGYISFANWVAGGGSLLGYEWMEPDPIPAGHSA